MSNNIKLSLVKKDLGYEEIKKLLSGKNNAVYVGVFANRQNVNGPLTQRQDTNLKKKIDLVKIAAANEFGATINHPGGTPYGFRTKKDFINRVIKFLKKGQGFLVLGVTKPHKIVIPQRSFLRSTLYNKTRDLQNLAKSLIQQILEQKINKTKALNIIGIYFSSEVKNTINSNIPPPNARSTIWKKKSSKTLRDKGRLINSITWEVRDK